MIRIKETLDKLWETIITHVLMGITVPLLFIAFSIWLFMLHMKTK